MSKITKVVVGRTFNMGNYQSLRLELEAEIAHVGDTVSSITVDLNDRLFAMKESLGQKYAEAMTIIQNSKGHSTKEVVAAQDYVDSVTDVLNRG